MSYTSVVSWSPDMPTLTDRGMAVALGALRRAAGTELLDRVGLRDAAERGLRRAARDGARAAGAASRPFAAAAKRLAGPARPSTAPRRGSFDLTPTEEQAMLQAAFRGFGDERLRPAALEADAACTPPAALLDQAVELGALLLSVPTELGGVVDERASVTTVLAAEALAHGDLGLAVASLSPASVATALALWGDADQQGTYLAPFTGDEPPVAAFAVLEPRPLFDPLALATTARRDGADLVLTGAKALVPRAADAELFLVAASVDCAPALVLVESGTEGVGVVPEPAMGVRAAATGRLVLDDVRVPATAVVGGGDPAVYAEAVQRARLGWCAVSLGAAQAVLDHVIPYVNQRETFGEPISHRQSVAFAVADIAVELEGMRLATYRAASLADQGGPFGHAAALARDLCARHGAAIGSHGVQLLGGHGYVKEHPVERWYRDLRAIGVMEGGLLV
jgi:alkylation response protein AidB-like acyl-CoA dehydrogenase